MPFQRQAGYTSHNKNNRPLLITARAALLEVEIYKNEKKVEYYEAAEPQQHCVACIFEDFPVMTVTGNHVNQGKVGKTPAKNLNQQSEQFTDQLEKTHGKTRQPER